MHIFCELFYVNIHCLAWYINVFLKCFQFFPSQNSNLVYSLQWLSLKHVHGNGVVYLTVLVPTYVHFEQYQVTSHPYPLKRVPRSWTHTIYRGTNTYVQLICSQLPGAHPLPKCTSYPTPQRQYILGQICSHNNHKVLLICSNYWRLL
jgi:hypothetical protein